MDFQDDKKKILKLLLNKFYIFLAYQFGSFSHNKLQKKTGHIGDGLHAEKDEAHPFFGGFKFTTEYNFHSGIPIYNSVNGISKFKAYNM